MATGRISDPTYAYVVLHVLGAILSNPPHAEPVELAGLTPHVVDDATVEFRKG